jgi:2-oxoglutarate ferredoxin oxidoreductase subunit gamma
MNKYYEVRLSGSGGQGLGLAGRVFSEAAILGDYNVCQTQSYGPEARGGSSRTDIIISRSEILFPNCRELDILLAMNQASADKFASDVTETGMILVDTTYVNQPPPGNVYEYPLSKQSIDFFGSPVAANMIALGMLAAVGRLFDIETWVKAIQGTVPRRYTEMNLNAFELGHKEGRAMLHVEEGRVRVAFDRKRPVRKAPKRENLC